MREAELDRDRVVAEPLLQGFALLDARVAYQAWPALGLFVGALDLTDVRRRPLDVTDTRPALGRQFYLGVSGDVD